MTVCHGRHDYDRETKTENNASPSDLYATSTLNRYNKINSVITIGSMIPILMRLVYH